jgi:signal peptidase II
MLCTPAADSRSMPEAPTLNPTQPRINPWLVVVLLALPVLVLDQITKWAVVQYLAGDDDPGRIDLISPWLALDYVENRGAAFGILQGRSDLLLIVAFIIVIGIAIMFQRMLGASRLQPIATGFIVGGAVGNIVDRVRFGFVIDFVAVGPWPKFNVADSAITIGVLLMVGAVLLAGDGSHPGPSNAESPIGRASGR